MTCSLERKLLSEFYIRTDRQTLLSLPPLIFLCETMALGLSSEPFKDPSVAILKDSLLAIEVSFQCEASKIKVSELKQTQGPSF